MKSLFIKTVIGYILFAAFIYGLAAFVQLSLDPNDWPKDVRFIVVLAWLFALLPAGLIFSGFAGKIEKNN